MFCGHCGKENPGAARFCVHCGRQVSHPPETAEERAHREQVELAALVAAPVPGDRCHRCSALNGLSTFAFALGKETSRENDYGATGASVAASAVTMALFGFGAIATPRSTTTYRTLRLDIVLCNMCKKKFTHWAGGLKRAAYESHPWFRAAAQLGYKTVIVDEKVVR